MYLVRSWPRLSQTFIVGEVLALERLGVELEIVALTRSGETLVQPQVADVRAPVRYLDERPPRALAADHLAVGLRSPLAYARTAAYAARNPGLSTGYATATTRGCLELAVRVAARIFRAEGDGVRIRHVHAHFAHDPALVALFAARITGVPYSVTAHARDLYQIPRESLVARASGATSLVTCCRANADYLDDTLPPDLAQRVRVLHHGVELARFVPEPGNVARVVPHLVSVGRLVQKKGFPDLFSACARLRSCGQDFRLVVYGDGPLRADLTRLRDDLGLAGHVELAGERDSDEIVQALRAADAFVLTPFVTDDGDRDGVPNVVVEAMACGLPVVTTTAGGITEVVEHEVNGLLAEPRDVEAISRNLGRVVGDADLRAALGRAGRQTVERGFDVDAAAVELADMFASSGGAR